MDKDTQDALIAAGSVIIGAWLLKKVFEGQYYKCPRCNNPVEKDTVFCPNCGQPIKWGVQRWQ